MKGTDDDRKAIADHMVSKLSQQFSFAELKDKILEKTNAEKDDEIKQILMHLLSRNNPGAAGNGPKEWRGYNLERVIIIAIDYMKQHFALPTEFADRRPIRDESPEGRDAGADGRRGGGLGERGGFGFGRGRGRGADRSSRDGERGGLLGRSRNDSGRSGADSAPIPRHEVKPGEISQDDLGFKGVRRRIPQRDLELWKEHTKKYSRVMDSMEKLTDVTKQNHPQHEDVASKLILLEFLKYITGTAKTSFSRIQDKLERTDHAKLSRDIFGEKEKKGFGKSKGYQGKSDLDIHRDLFETGLVRLLSKDSKQQRKAEDEINVMHKRYEHDSETDSVSSSPRHRPPHLSAKEATPPPEQTFEEAMETVQDWISDINRMYRRHRECDESYNGLHEAVYFSTVLRKARRNRDDESYAKIVNDLITHMVLHVKLSDDEIVEKIRSVVGSGAEASNGEPDPARKTTKDVINELLRDEDFETGSLKELKGPIRTSVTTYYDQLVTKVEIRPEIMAMTVPINEQNGLHELKEYIFRVFLETLYGMMESGQVSGLDKTKIKVNFLEEFVGEISQFLILCNFTIYEAVVYQTQGILGEVVRNILKTKAADIPERLHYETLVKLCLSWTDALIRKKSPSNKLLTAKSQRTTIKWKLYVFVMAELLVDSTDGIEFNMGPPQESVAEELINRKLKKSSMVDSFKLQSDKSGKVVAIPIFQESDDPGFQMRGQVTTSVIGKKKDGGGNAGAADAASDPEPFIDYNWNLVNSEIVRVPAQRNKSVKLVMAGTPRIKRLAKLDIWASQETDKLGCEIYVNEDGAVMSAHHSVVVTFCNPTDKIVVIEAKTRLAHCKVKSKEESDLNPVTDPETLVLNFIRHYYKLNGVQGIELNPATGEFTFGNHFNASIDAGHKVALKWSRGACDSSKDLYTVETILHFLENFDPAKVQYSEYMEKAVAAKKDLVRGSDSESIFKFFDFDEGMLRRELKYNNNQDDFVNLEEPIRLPRLPTQEPLPELEFNGFPEIEGALQEAPWYKLLVTEMVVDIKEKYELTEDSEAKKRLDQFLRLMHGCDINMEKLQFNGFRAGGVLRQKFTTTILAQLVKKCLDSPNIFNECAIVVDGEAVDDISTDFKSNRQLKNLCTFLELFTNVKAKRAIDKLKPCEGTENEDRTVNAPVVTEDAEAALHLARCEIKTEMATTREAKKEKHETLNVYIGTSPVSVAYIIANEDNTVVKKLSSRFYNDVEYDNFSFRGWKPAVSWVIRENLDLLIQQPVKFLLNDPGLPLNNCTREGNPNFIKDLCKIDHTFALLTSENPANGVALKKSVRGSMVKKHWIQEILTIVTTKLCAGMQEQIKLQKEARKERFRQAQAARHAQAAASE